MSEPLLIFGSGAYTPVGVSSAQTCAAIRAGISGFCAWDLSHLRDDIEPLTAALAPLLPPPRENKLFERLVRMAVPAIRDCLKAFQVQDASHIVLLLGVRDTFRTHPNLDGRDSEMVAAIEAALRIRFHEDSSIVPEGRPAALLSLSRAGELLKNDGIEGCIVGGVDCMANWHDFRRFSASYRIRREDVPAGFIPGEGATFVAVARHHLVPRGTVEALEIVSVGIGHEDPGTTILSDGFPTGQGLYQALDTTLRQVDVSEGSIDFRVSDINGEHYRAVEAMLGVTRFYRTRREHLTTWIPAASTGDIGAAFGALLMIMAMTGMTKAYAPGSLAMCESCSDTGLVATCLVRHAAKQ